MEAAMDTEVQNRFQRPEFDHVWEVYKHVSEFEHHFNTLQSAYRTLASTWLLAMFVGVGYVLTSSVDWPIDKFFIVAAVAVFTTVGLIILWLMDLLVYQKLLHAAFVEGKMLELDYPWLPQIRNGMVRSLPKWRTTHRTVWYYVAMTSAALVIAEISLTLGTYGILGGSGQAPGDFASQNALTIAGLTAVSGLVVAVLIELKIIAASRDDDPESRANSAEVRYS
jgi:hypothetical protein